MLSAARRKRRRLGLPRGNREPPEPCCSANKGKPPKPRNAPETHQVTQHATRGAAKRAASEKPKPRKRAKAEAAFGNEQAPLLGLDVYQKDEADLRARAPAAPSAS